MTDPTYSFEELNRWSAIRLVGGFLYGLMWIRLSELLAVHPWR